MKRFLFAALVGLVLVSSADAACFGGHPRVFNGRFRNFIHHVIHPFRSF